MKWGRDRLAGYANDHGRGRVPKARMAAQAGQRTEQTYIITGKKIDV